MLHQAQDTVAFDLNQARYDYTPKSGTEEVARNFEYDMQRFIEHSSTQRINPDPVALCAYLTSAYHSLEKGLAMALPKAGFGARKIRPILAAIHTLEQLQEASFATQGARGCLKAYIEYHDVRGLALPAELERELRDFVLQMPKRVYPGGAIRLTRAQIEAATAFDYERFVFSRSSVRHFSGESVSQDRLANIVRQALKSPRSCNREMRRVHYSTDSDQMQRLLSFHSGNRGFGHSLGAVLVVTSDLRELDMIGERNQGWVDGGIFAMALVFAAHANRLGSCMLNWSESCDQDRHLREAFDIPDNEIIITLLGLGHLPEAFEVAASPSPHVDDVMCQLEEVS
ncbi:MAG: nitroreductase family protein [Pseudomonadales bacterium]